MTSFGRNEDVIIASCARLTSCEFDKKIYWGLCWRCDFLILLISSFLVDQNGIHCDERYIVSNHRHIDCLFNNLVRLTPKKTTNLRLTGPLWRTGDVISVSMTWCNNNGSITSWGTNIQWKFSQNSIQSNPLESSISMSPSTWCR